MKKILLLTFLLLGLSITSANAAIITNTCTSTYQMLGFTLQVSGSDTAAVNVGAEPYISVTKYVKNIRSGIESNDMVTALSGDTIEFRIVWSNTGGSIADTSTLTDYIPAGLTYVGSSITDTEVNCDTPGTAVESGGKIEYVTRGAKGTDSPPPADGVIKFRATVD